MYCKNCGQSLNPNNKFCKHCGQEVKLSRTTTLKNKSLKWFVDHKKGFIIVAVIIVAIWGLALLDDYSIPSDYNVASSVVNILCTSKNSRVDSGGSGTIITEGGLILTNSHIIPQVNEVPSVLNDRCFVAIPDETTGQPREIYLARPNITKGFSKAYDIATLEIDSIYVDDDGKSWGTLPKTFSSFQDGPKCKEGEFIKLGDSVRIYGYPITSGGYNLTITEGVVSSFTENGLILTSAKVDSGNSGGLAIDQDGCFIGIPSAVIEGDYQNLGVIIPPNLIDDFVNEVPAQPNSLIASCDVNECYFSGQCIPRPANSSCVSNDSNRAWICNTGYIESGNYCVKPTPIPTPKSNDELCREKYGWNTYFDGTYCQCNYGYVWNKNSTVCISRTEDCQESWPNTYWDGTFSTEGRYNCDCISGYVWNNTNTACITRTSVDEACRLKYGYSSYYLGYVEDSQYMCK